MKVFVTSLLIMFTAFQSFSQHSFGLKTEPLGIPLGLYQLSGEYPINRRYSIGLELISLNTDNGFLIDHENGWKGESLSVNSRRYFQSNSPEGSFLQLAARYSENSGASREGGFSPEDKMISADLGYGKQFMWNKISFDPYFAFGVGSLKQNENWRRQNSGETTVQGYGYISLDLGYWF